MKRLVLTMATAGLLTIPFGVAFADDETPGPVDDGTAPVECDQSRQQLHQGDAAHDGMQLRYGPGADGEHDGFGPYARVRNEVRVEDGNDDALQYRQRDQINIDDDDATLQQQDRNRINVDDDAVGPGDGTAATSGTCPGACSGDRDQIRSPDRIQAADELGSPGPGRAGAGR